MPFSPAAEFAGTVESLGAGVSGFAAGDRVLGYSGYGAARERIAIKAERLVKIPDSLDFDRAAGLCVTYGTTLHALKDRAKLKSGETLAVLGASGGVGLAAVELGKIMGARVIACASSADKIAFARKHGADDGIDYGKDDLKEALRRADRRARRRRDLRSGRRRLCGSSIALDRLAGTLSRDRLCRRRNSQAAAQSCAAQRLRRARRVLGLMDRSAIRQAIAPIPSSFSPGARKENCRRMCTPSIRWRSARRAQGHRRAPGDGQSYFASLTLFMGIKCRRFYPSPRRA